MKIPNLYQAKYILNVFKEVYVLEKIHGTSAHIKKFNGEITYFSGEQRYLFKTIHTPESIEHIRSSSFSNIVIYGECYGYKIQRFNHVYGNKLRFVAFDVKLNDRWCEVPFADKLCKEFGIEFVHYDISDTSIESLNYHRDKPSEQAKRNGMGIQNSEGIVIRPLIELRNNYSRVIAKHKRDDFRETKTPRQLDDKLQVFTKASKIADEFVTFMRLEHVIQQLQKDTTDIKDISNVINLMVNDVLTEGGEEIQILNTKEKEKTIKEIKRKTARMFKQRLKTYANA